MNNRLPVSPEYDAAGHAAGESMRSVIERKIYREGVGPYLLGATKRARETDAFDDVHIVKEAIDHSHGYRDLTGLLFLDGGVLAIDWLQTYAPAVVPRLHAHLAAFEKTASRIYLDGYATSEDELAYVDALRHRGDESRVPFAMDYAAVIADVAAWRGFSPKDPYRQFVVTQGAGYVLKAAETAYEADFKAFRRNVAQAPAPRGDDYPAADLLIREAEAWRREDEQRDQAA